MFWGLISQVQVLKVGVPDVGSDPSLLREQLWDGSSLSIVGLHAERGVYGETVSQHLVPTFMWVFSHLPNVLRVI